MTRVFITITCCFFFGFCQGQFAVFQENTGAPSSFLDEGEKVSTVNIGYTSTFGTNYLSVGFQRSNGRTDIGISTSYVSGSFGSSVAAFNPFLRYFFLQANESLPLAASASITYQLLTDFEATASTATLTPALYMVFETDNFKIIPEFNYLYTRSIDQFDSGALTSFMVGATLVMKNADRYIYVTPKMNFDEGGNQFLIAAGITLGSFSDDTEN